MEVALEHVRVQRGGRDVLDVAALGLAGGRTTAILGPNGSGKTTLLRVIAGLEPPRTGRVLVDGAPVRPGLAAYVFQEQVFLRQSVRENLELGLRLRGAGAADRRARVEEAAERLGIAHLLARRADQLSGGEGRRVSLARALCLRAPLVLLDEPLEGLDQRTYGRLMDELPELLAAFQATTLLVTHSRHEALRLAQDLVVLIDGHVRAAGEKRAVATQPADAGVAEVLGYLVLEVNRRRLAVPPQALRLGAGSPQWAMTVDGLLDVVDHLELVGTLGSVRVHVRLPAGADVPGPGDRVLVHASRWSDLGRR